MLTLAGLLAVQACSLSPLDLNPLASGPGRTTGSEGSASAPRPAAQTMFVVNLPEPLLPDENLTLSIMDEVTGLSVNAVNYTMSQRDPLRYTAVVALPLNAAVKYRYARRSAVQINEDTSWGTAIRYRLYIVNGPGEVVDTIADWADKAYVRQTGTVQGRVLNADTGTPLANLLVSAAGSQYVTDSAGRFEFARLPVATHNLVVYALDGTYLPFQQGATVGADQITSVEARLKPAAPVNVTFLVTMPTDTVPGVPVRIAGNLLQLGNTFADLQGGLSTSADRMPVMNLTADGRYELSLRLPAGAYVQYKYTLGDGFWNAEHTSKGAFMLRELVVPTEDVVLADVVQTWKTGPAGAMLFEVTTPSVTPPGDIIYIQFNPYGWTEPIPMWPLGNNHWSYKLYGPLSTVGPFGYRYCRNGQCGSADDAATRGNDAPGKQASASLLTQDIKDVVGAWAWFENPEPTTLIGSFITARPDGFVSGVELQPFYRPNWSYHAPQALANIQALGANHVVVTPTWTFSSASPVTLSPIPGQDPLWTDTAVMISQARALGLNVALFPAPNLPAGGTQSASDRWAGFWSSAARDDAWWSEWFDHYRAFAVNYADLATQTGAQQLILGGEWITPALPGGTLADGNASNQPADVDGRWKALIFEVRQHFDGQVVWALPFESASLQTTLPFLQDTDGVYLLWDAPLASVAGAGKPAYVDEAGRLLDNQVSPLSAVIGKPVFVAISYPSAAGADAGCVADGAGGCLERGTLDQPNADEATVGLDLQGQADLYEAVLTALNARPWVAGVISRGYYLPAALQDKSTSVHGKPAADILWYWLPRLTGLVQ